MNNFLGEHPYHPNIQICTTTIINDYSNSESDAQMLHNLKLNYLKKSYIWLIKRGILGGCAITVPAPLTNAAQVLDTSPVCIQSIQAFDLTTRDSYFTSFHEPYFSKKHIFHESHRVKRTKTYCIKTWK